MKQTFNEIKLKIVGRVSPVYFISIYLFPYCYFITKYLGFDLGNQAQEKDIYFSPILMVILLTLHILPGFNLTDAIRELLWQIFVLWS